MNRIRFMAHLVAYVIRPESAPAGDLAAEVRTVFATKCTACHGPDLAKPKGRFGYVLDLARLAGDPEKIIRGAPEESELWELVRRGEMPPEDSPAGPLTADQKETVRAWIAAGAPAPANENGATVSPPDTSPSGAPGLTPTLRQLGRLHVVLVHFPIALLIAAAAGEVWSILRGCGLFGVSCGRPEVPWRDADEALEVIGDLTLVREAGVRGGAHSLPETAAKAHRRWY
jgi:mono/diheme cytochrome c family protein